MVALRRLAAYALDWLLFAVWCTAVFGTVWTLQSGEPWWPSRPWASQALGFTLTTLPFGIYFVWLEAAPGRSTIGKRVFSLRVESVGAPRKAALVRTLGKLAPWEIGHVAGHHFWIAESNGGAPDAWVPWAAVGAMALALLYVALLFRSPGLTPYDRMARTRVVYVHG